MTERVTERAKPTALGAPIDRVDGRLKVTAAAQGGGPSGSGVQGPQGEEVKAR